MGLVKTRRLAAMHPPSPSTYAEATVDKRLRRTRKMQRSKAGMRPPVKKCAWKGNGYFLSRKGSTTRGKDSK